MGEPALCVLMPQPLNQGQGRLKNKDGAEEICSSRQKLTNGL
jgi:hypothetical protein